MKATVPILILMILFYSGCSNTKKDGVQSETLKVPVTKDSIIAQERHIPPASEVEKSPLDPDSIISTLSALPDSSFSELNTFEGFFAFDMKYATNDNFLKEKVYDCPKCLLRVEVIRALVKANRLFEEKGYKIKFFDCYRPLYIQKRMWAIKPDSRYVANPNTSGSIHNRGAAVDITLVDIVGKELDMGTVFDHFGEEAHHAYSNLAPGVITNRKLLKEIMEKSGFKAQNSEWWHYSFLSNAKYPLSNQPIICEK